MQEKKIKCPNYDFCDLCEKLDLKKSIKSYSSQIRHGGQTKKNCFINNSIKIDIYKFHPNFEPFNN